MLNNLILAKSWVAFTVIFFVCSKEKMQKKKSDVNFRKKINDAT